LVPLTGVSGAELMWFASWLKAMLEQSNRQTNELVSRRARILRIDRGMRRSFISLLCKLSGGCCEGLRLESGLRPPSGVSIGLEVVDKNASAFLLQKWNKV
jgi:hypothetical protein